jgi:hypothetical protein
MLDFLKPKCSACGKVIDTRGCRDGFGGGLIEAICWDCVARKIAGTLPEKGERK